MQRTARCACGSASVSVRGEPTQHGVCHCTNCMRRTGSALGVSTYFQKSQVEGKTGEMRLYGFTMPRWITIKNATSAPTAVRRSSGICRRAPNWSALLAAASQAKHWENQVCPLGTRRNCHGWRYRTNGRRSHLQETPNPSLNRTAGMRLQLGRRRRGAPVSLNVRPLNRQFFALFHRVSQCNLSR